MDFRAYPVGDDGHLMPPTVLVSRTDRDAIEQVKKLLNGRPIQMWEGSRLVGWFEIIDGEFYSVTSYSDCRHQILEQSAPRVTQPHMTLTPVPEAT